MVTLPRNHFGSRNSSLAFVWLILNFTFRLDVDGQEQKTEDTRTQTESDSGVETYSSIGGSFAQRDPEITYIPAGPIGTTAG